MQEEPLKELPVEDHRGHRERLRSRFEQTSLSGFAPHEMLELLLTYAIPRKDTKPLARALLGHFGSLPAVLQASGKDLCAVGGIGPRAASLISLILPLSKAYEQSLGKGQTALSDAAAIFAHCRALFYGDRYEHFFVLGLDGRMRLLSSTQVASGDEGETAVYPRLVASALLRCGAARAIICHNHPGGEALPSAADRHVTRTLERTLADLSILLYDHVIVAGDRTYSFRDHGLLGTGSA